MDETRKGNPRLEYRNPKEVRIPKTETPLPPHSFLQWTRRMAFSVFGFLSGFGNSDFGIRENPIGI
jgi:hypothetical protein